MARFAIFPPCVSVDVRILEIELRGKLKRQVAFADVLLVFARIEGEVPSRMYAQSEFSANRSHDVRRDCSGAQRAALNFA